MRLEQLRFPPVRQFFTQCAAALSTSLSCSASASGDRKPGQPAKTSTQLEARHKAQQRILLPFTRTDLVDSIPLLSSLHHPVVSVHFPPPIALLCFESTSLCVCVCARRLWRGQKQE